MDEDEDFAPRRGKAAPKDLGLMAVTELEAYIAELQAEIQRARAEIAQRQTQRQGAEALFKR